MICCCRCPLAFTGRRCETKINDPNNCTSQRPPLLPCSGSCSTKDDICNGTQSCGYPSNQVAFNCGGKDWAHAVIEEPVRHSLVDFSNKEVFVRHLDWRHKHYAAKMLLIFNCNLVSPTYQLSVRNAVTVIGWTTFWKWPKYNLHDEISKFSWNLNILAKIISF